jgi:hypothetical protein
MENSIYDDSDWKISNIYEIIKENVASFLLLFVVFGIIYVVDHISNINTILYAMPVMNIPSKSDNVKRHKRSKK